MKWAVIVPVVLALALLALMVWIDWAFLSAG